mgnify:CR=1 FL=1
MTALIAQQMADIEANVLMLSGRIFHHRFVQTAGVRCHVVEGGVGPTVVLLAGFPQSWYAWRRVMPLLAANYHVVAIDLPGQGDSDKPAGGYDTFTTGERLHALLTAMELSSYALVGHDIGAWVAYPYAARYEREVQKLVLLDANIPGVTLRSAIVLGPENWKSWHFLFNTIPDLPEALLTGRERTLIEWFFNRKTANQPGVFTAADIDEYERVYRQPGGLRGMLGYYRAVDEDVVQNASLRDRRLTMPVLALGGEKGSAPDLFDAITPMAVNVTGGVVPDCGHYIPEEKPQWLVDALHDFLTTTT